MILPGPSRLWRQAKLAPILMGFAAMLAGPAKAAPPDVLGPCLKADLAASHDSLIRALQAEGWTEGTNRDHDRAGWFRGASFDPPKRFWNAAAANNWKRDIRAWWDSTNIGYVTLGRGPMTLVVKGKDAPLGRGPAHCMLIANDLDGQDHGPNPRSSDNTATDAYLWTMQEVAAPAGFSDIEGRFSTLELAEGERMEMYDVYMRLED